MHCANPNAYYAARAAEYERVYDKPERQADLRQLLSLVPELLRDSSVLEVACGTGYWTQAIAQTARSIHATDLAEETLAIARAKALAPERVSFQVADALALPHGLGSFDAAFAGFWWSHLPRHKVAEFLASLHARLKPGAKVVLLDNLHVAGSSTPISRKSSHGDTYQRRQLSNGSVYEVLKNFPTQDELLSDLVSVATNVRYLALDFYWLVQYEAAA